MIRSLLYRYLPYKYGRIKSAVRGIQISNKEGSGTSSYIKVENNTEFIFRNLDFIFKTRLNFIRAVRRRINDIDALNDSTKRLNNRHNCAKSTANVVGCTVAALRYRDESITRAPVRIMTGSCMQRNGFTTA